MSRTHRHIKSQSNTINEGSYAILQQPTNAAFIPKETMEINEETESLRQEGEIVHSQSALAKDKKTERQKKEESA
tara:strand:+ start:449 stop:673 length:225 start_codon:yes stop_codon:yes gene_type:complete